MPTSWLAESKDSKYDNVTTGGPWRYGVRNQCRPKIHTHNEGFAYYYLSFRCCAEADGKPTDPRSPKQIHRRNAGTAVRRRCATRGRQPDAGPGGVAQDIERAGGALGPSR